MIKFNKEMKVAFYCRIGNEPKKEILSNATSILSERLNQKLKYLYGRSCRKQVRYFEDYGK